MLTEEETLELFRQAFECLDRIDACLDYITKNCEARQKELDMSINN